MTFFQESEEFFYTKAIIDEEYEKLYEKKNMYFQCELRSRMLP